MNHVSHASDCLSLSRQSPRHSLQARSIGATTLESPANSSDTMLPGGGGFCFSGSEVLWPVKRHTANSTANATQRARHRVPDGGEYVILLSVSMAQDFGPDFAISLTFRRSSMSC